MVSLNGSEVGKPNNCNRLKTNVLTHSSLRYSTKNISRRKIKNGHETNYYGTIVYFSFYCCCCCCCCLYPL